MENTRPNVLIIGLNYAPEVTGIAPYTSGLAEGLKQLGHETAVITGYPHYPSWTIDTRYEGWSMGETINGVDVKRVRQYTPAKPKLINRLLMEANFGIRSVFRKWHDPDVVILVSPALIACAVVSMRIRLSRSKPKVGIWVQDLYSKGVAETNAAPSQVARVVAWIEAAVLKSADGVAVIHDRFRSEIIKSLSVSEDSISVIRNWSHLTVLPDVDTRATRRKFGWQANQTVALHAGNMGAKQGLENVVEAAKYSAKMGIDIQYVLVGNGNQRLRLIELSQGVPNIQFIDTLSDTDYWAIMKSADVLLVNEKTGVSDMAVPSKLTSYFATGRPVLAATEPDSTTAFELRKSGAGVRVDPGSPILLAKAIVDIASDQQRSDELGLAGAAYITEVLGKDHAISLFEAWITTLDAKNPAKIYDGTDRNV